MIENCIEIACNAHYGQIDRGGMPYIYHCLHVMSAFKDEPSLACAAVMHDVLEDSDFYRSADLIDAGANRRVVNIVETLTHMPGEDYFSYISRIKENEDATRIKLVDLDHNMDLSRLNRVTEKDLTRLEKYKKAFNILRGNNERD